MNKNRNILLGFYTAISLVVILCSLPDLELQNIGSALAMVTLVFAYIARARFPRDESFEENHATYIIRTIWIYTSIATFGMVGASFIVWQQGNMTSIDNMMHAFMDELMPDITAMKASAGQYLVDNQDLLRQQFSFWLFPAQLYMVWRILQGGGRAFKGYRIANPKKWF